MTLANISPASDKAAPLVSVWMITYNHAAYVARAIASVLAQQTDFSFELVIGDDASTDTTAEICEELARAHPDIIRFERNQQNIGMQQNVLATLNRCAGTYVAMLEGDDEWTDPAKLAKQVRILRDDPGLVLCYSNAYINDTQNPDSSIYFRENAGPPQRMDGYSAVKHCVIPTCTVVFRNHVGELPSWFTEAKASAYFLFYILGKYGDLYYLDEPLALYNHHYQGMSRRTSITGMLVSDSLLGYKLIDYYGGDPRMRAIILDKHMGAVDSLFHTGDFAEAVQLFWRLPLAEIFADRSRRRQLSRLFAKIHFLQFLSQRRRSGTH